MILAVVALVLAIGIVWYMLDEWSVVAVFLIATGAIVLVIMLCVLGVRYIGVDGYVASNHERYEMLTYQWENNFYDNDNDVGKYQLVSDIRNWNEDLRKFKALQHDFWIGVFIPDVYDQFEFISIVDGMADNGGANCEPYRADNS